MRVYSKYDRSFILGVLNGILFNLAEALIGGTTVLPIFISKLTESKVLIGLAGTMGNAGWFMPQLLVASQIEHVKRKMPLYIWSGFVRFGAMWAIAVLVALSGHTSTAALLAGFFILYAAYSLGGGVAGIPFMDIVAKTVPPERRGTYFGARFAIGGIGAALTGIFVRGVLQSRAFPTSFAILFFVAAVVVTAAVVSFCLVKEPAGPICESRVPFLQFIRRGPFLLKNVRSYRLLLVVRILLGVWGMALPFYIIFARDRLGITPGDVGTLLAIQMAGAFVSNFLWGYLSNHIGNKIVLEMVSATSIACPLIALAAALWTPAWPLLCFAVIFFLIGMTWSGVSLGYNNYVLEVSPAAERPTYLGFMNTYLSPVLLLSAVGGLVIDKASYEALFVISSTAALAALIFAQHLEEPRMGRRPPATRVDGPIGSGASSGGPAGV